MKTTLVIMAAGLGSRYGGNKQVDGVGPNNEILMEYSIYDAIRAGFNKVRVHHQTRNGGANAPPLWGLSGTEDGERRHAV